MATYLPQCGVGYTRLFDAEGKRSRIWIRHSGFAVSGQVGGEL